MSLTQVSVLNFSVRDLSKFYIYFRVKCLQNILICRYQVVMLMNNVKFFFESLW